jgi:hypothetical protein
MKYLLLLLLALQSMLAAAHSSCSSDGVKPVKHLTERFIHADCAACWTSPMATSKSGLVLDWIVPSAAGDDAALSAAANRDAGERHDALALAFTAGQQLHRTTIQAPAAYQLRVAHGLPVNGYIGTSIELKKRPKSVKTLTSYLLLIEHLPKGTADSPIDRLLVRNMQQESWSLSSQPMLLTRRPMSIPAGVHSDNLRVVGWVQDTKGHVLAMAQSRCITRP